MRWALAMCVCACGARSDLSPPLSLDATAPDVSAVAVDSAEDIVVDVIDAAPQQKPLVDGLHGAYGIAVDDTNVYFSEWNAPFRISKCAKTGCGGEPTVLANDITKTFALDPMTLYWRAGTPNGSAVHDCATTGCPQPGTLLSANAIGGIALYGNRFAWTVAANEQGTVNTCVLPSCAATTATVVGNQYNPSGVAVDSTNVYWSNWIQVLQCPLAGCDGAPIVLSEQPGGAIAVDSTFVYWTNGSIVKCAIGGCGDVLVYVYVQQTTFGADQLVLDGDWIYWLGDGILKCRKTGCQGDPTVVVPVTPDLGIGAFAIDDKYVWYTLDDHKTDGRVVKAPK